MTSNTIRLLYIDDRNSDLLAILEAIREKQLTCDAVLAKTSEEALLQLVNSPFDLIIANDTLAVSSFTSTEKSFHNLPLILLTRLPEDQAESCALKLRAYDYVAKDEEGRYLDALLLAIEQTIRRKRIQTMNQYKYTEGQGTSADKRSFTDQSEVEDELQWIHERYSALFDRSMDCIYMFDFGGQLTDANSAALKLLGYAKEDIPSLNIFKLIDPKEIQSAKQRIERILCDGLTTEPAEFKLIRKDGQIAFLETTASIVFHDGRSVAIQAIGRDITSRKHAEKALRESEEKFRSLAENMQAAVGIVLGTRFVYANQYMARMLGYSVNELLSSEFPRFVHPADRERLIDLVRRRQSGESVPNHYEFLALTKNGETRCVDFSAGTMVYGGKPAIIGTGIDVTERKQTEERLGSYTRGLKLLADSALRLLSTDCPGDALRRIFEELADDLGVRIYLNYMVTEDGTRLNLHNYRGLEPALVKQIELIEFGRTVCGIVAKEKRPLIIENILQSAEPELAPLRFLGIRAYACHPLLGDRGLMGTLALCAEDRDSFSKDEIELMRLTSHQAAMALEHQRLTRELERRAAEMARANATKDHFLAVLSHELRTPLTPVLMGVSLLQNRPGLDPAVYQSLETIRLNVEMEARLIDDLLDVTRIERGKVRLDRSPVDLCSVIRKAVEVCRPDIEARGLNFGADLEPSNPCWVEADGPRLEQVFWNLLKNAIKFTPNGGCVGIRCGPEDGHVLVEVNDSGIGIEPEALPKIFKAFEQTERSVSQRFGGLGLGLAISKALVEMHGGEIEAQSEGLDRGATFRVRLPMCPPRGKPRALIAATPARTSVRPLKILLVEDHGITAQMIQTILQNKGHSVKTAGDITTALNLAGRHSFDLLFSDLGLPDGSGHELMRELRKRGHRFPGIALSGYGQDDDIKRSYHAGFAAHLIKPASCEAVLKAVDSVADGDGGGISKSGDLNQNNAPVFDADKALERCYGQREMLEKMISLFPLESAELLSRMRLALERCDFMEAGKAVHRLKGDLVYLGAQTAASAALKVEEAAKSGDNTAATKAIEELEHQIELLKKILDSRI